MVPGFARQFLAANWRRVLQLMFIQAVVIWYAAVERWLMCAFVLLWGSVIYWDLIKRAAGVPELPGKRREDMTPREAFWLDLSAVFERGRRRERVG